MNKITNFINEKKTIIILISITLIGFYLRIKNLGELGFRWDEDITSLAVKGILENGYPLLPAGMIYPRSGIFLYFHTLSAQILGFSEFSLRLPAALFSVATIPMAYLFSAKLLNNKIAILVAICFAISVWQIEMARNARMYAPFAFFYILTVFAFYYYHIENPDKDRKYLVLILALFTVTLHQLGFSLALLYLFPLLIKKSSYKSCLYLIFNFSIIMIFFLIWDKMQLYLMHMPVHSNQQSVDTLVQQTSNVPSLVNQILGFIKGMLDQFLTPSFDLIATLYKQSTLAFYLISVIYFGSCFIYFKNIKHKSFISHILIFVILLFSFLQQFTLVFLSIFLYLLIQKTGLLALKNLETKKLLTFSLITFLLWILFGYFFVSSNEYFEAEKNGQLTYILKTILGFPSFYVIWAFMLERPIMSLLAIMGLTWSFHVISQDLNKTNLKFLLYVFLVPLFVTGLFKADYQSFRYVMHFDVLFFSFVALGLVKSKDLIHIFLTIYSSQTHHESSLFNFFARNIQHRSTNILITFSIVLALFLTDLSPLRAWYLPQSEYGENQFFLGLINLRYYPDQKTPALYVKKMSDKEDLIIVLDSREQYNYIGRVDYWIRTDIYARQTYHSNGKIRDLYVDTPLITSLTELKRILKINNGRRIWIVASSRMLTQTRAVDQNIKDFFQELSENVVYVGQDEDTKVYKL